MTKIFGTGEISLNKVPEDDIIEEQSVAEKLKEDGVLDYSHSIEENSNRNMINE